MSEGRWLVSVCLLYLPLLPHTLGLWQQSPMEKHRHEKGSERFRALARWLTGRYWNVAGSVWTGPALGFARGIGWEGYCPELVPPSVDDRGAKGQKGVSQKAKVFSNSMEVVYGKKSYFKLLEWFIGGFKLNCYTQSQFIKNYVIPSVTSIYFQKCLQSSQNNFFLWYQRFSI